MPCGKPERLDRLGLWRPLTKTRRGVGMVFSHAGSIVVAAVGAWLKWRRSSVRSDVYFHVSLRRSGKPSRRASSSAWRRVMSPSFLEGGGQGVKEGVH